MTEEINTEKAPIKVQSLPNLARKHVKELFRAIPSSYVYHNFRHTEEVAEAVRLLAKEFGLSGNERRLLEVAAWFHDAAYNPGPSDGHEIRGAAAARKFLETQVEHEVSEADIQQVEKCILSTRMDTIPESLNEMILKDADHHHIAKKDHAKYADLLRMEWELIESKVYTDTEWIRQNIDFLENQQFYTTIARNEWEKVKQKHLLRLRKQLVAHTEDAGDSPLKELAKVKEKRVPRGVETMFRVTLRNHIHLSRIADNKANFLLSISAIILSLLLGNLITDNKPVMSMLMPSIYFLMVCIVTMVFAILATRPNITKGTFSRENLLSKKVNILFFGNFHSMPLEEFDWGMDQLMQNEDLLYHSLTTDLYFLGKVLHKKYQYLRTAFQVFMFGLISSALFYLVMLIFY